MNKIRTAAQLQDYLDREMSWRLREMADIKKVIGSSMGPQKQMILRASVPLLYAHWEGFIRNTSCAYADFLSNRNLKYSDLKMCFLGVPAKESIKRINETNKLHRLGEAIEDIFSLLPNNVQINLKPHLDRVGNLNYSIFSGVINALGIEINKYETKENLIDKSLLKKRNSIAHGEYLEVDEIGVSSLLDEIVGLMRGFKNDIENAVVLESYKK